MQSSKLQNQVDEWLKSLGFVRGNPFASAQADSEKEQSLLPELFVHIPGFDHVQGEESIVVFAPRGGGKSALRVMLAAKAAPIDPDRTLLAVEYTDFDPLLDLYREKRPISVQAHLPHLLRAGVKSLLNAFLDFKQDDSEVRQRRIRRVALIHPADRSHLARLLRVYAPDLLFPDSLYRRFSGLSSDLTLDALSISWRDFEKMVKERRLNELLWRIPTLNANAAAGLLADLNDFPEWQPGANNSPREQVINFVSLCQAMGFTAVHFLIDRVDEYPETVNNPEAQADLVAPLLGHLNLLEMPGIAFKFFLSQEARDILLDRDVLRLDRIRVEPVIVQWHVKQLRELLNQRLAVYSMKDFDRKQHPMRQAPQITELTQICRDQNPDLGNFVEQGLLQAAQGSPRQLLQACQHLCETHVFHSGPNGPIERKDWERARLKWERNEPVAIMETESPTVATSIHDIRISDPPTLRLRLAIREMVVGDRVISLTPLQHRIMKAFVAMHGRISREQFAEQVWKTKEGITDQAIDGHITRIRKRLQDDSSDPHYLETIKGWGFRLKNYVVED